VARDESGRLAGIAPFYRRPIRLRGFLTYRCLCRLGDRGSLAEYPDLIVRRDQEESVLAAIGAALGRCRDWDWIWVYDRLARMADLHVSRRDAPFSAIELPPVWDAYLAIALEQDPLPDVPWRQAAPRVGCRPIPSVSDAALQVVETFCDRAID